LLEPFVHELWPWKFPFLPLLSRTLCNLGLFFVT
jgi:hypothetical protein